MYRFVFHRDGPDHDTVLGRFRAAWGEEGAGAADASALGMSRGTQKADPSASLMVAVGIGDNNSGVILLNDAPSSASASIATPRRRDSLSGFADVPASWVASETTVGAKTLQPPLDTAAIDQFFAAVGKVDQRLWLAYDSLRPHHTVANANWDDFGLVGFSGTAPGRAGR
jgi:hypothetical protein